MRLYELFEAFELPECPALLDEEGPGAPLSSEQLRKQKDRDQKKLQKANEITRIAAVKAATVRAEVG